MAGASDKKQAASNTKILKEIHTLNISSIIIASLIIFSFNRPQSKKWFIIFNLISIGFQYILEKTGRPKYGLKNGSKLLISSGEDLTQSGLTEYFFDIIYLTNLCNIILIIFGSNYIWLLFLSIPIYAGYKFRGLISLVLNMLGIKTGGNKNSNDSQIEKEQQGPVKSKRQTKLEARGNKQKVKYSH
ncbi:unnamed protein product [[Candida] boidinii]|nr:unnamed protein product [[Candida] boidinii]